MENKNLLFRLWRRASHLLVRPLAGHAPLRWLARLPAVVPTNAYLAQLTETSERRTPLNLKPWREQRQWALQEPARPHFRLFYDVADDDRERMMATLTAARIHSYPLFEMLLLHEEGLSLCSRKALQRFATQDARLRLSPKERFYSKNIDNNSCYQVFVSTHCLLFPDALWTLAQWLRERPKLEYAYSETERGRLALCVFSNAFWRQQKIQCVLQGAFPDATTHESLKTSAKQPTELPILASTQPDYPMDVQCFEDGGLFFRLKRRFSHRIARQRKLGADAQQMAKLPPVIPSKDYLRWLNASPWPEYRDWMCASHSLISSEGWRAERQWAIGAARDKPVFSLIVPVFNTEPAQLFECVFSVRCQSYPYWELWLIDDASDDASTLAMLAKLCGQDVRVHCLRNQSNSGISRSSNRALQAANGQFVAFLDHDDMLAPNALYHMAQAIEDKPEVDFLYSDRDMLSPLGLRCMYLMKPQWSPETLLSGNYLFHLCVYRKSLVAELGYLRPGFDGSQDYDLALRVAEKARSILHVPKVLYHWRQHEGSVSMAHNCKDYAYEAGMAALREALQRRGVEGEVAEIDSLWRGNYRVRLRRPAASAILHLPCDESADFPRRLDQQIRAAAPEKELLLIMGPGLRAASDSAMAELASCLQIDGVGFASGKVVSADGCLLHAGLVLRPEGRPLAAYQGYPATEPGYMASTAIVRNVSVPHPWCLAMRRELWREYFDPSKGLSAGFQILDLVLRASESGWRTVYTPFASFEGVWDSTSEDSLWPSAAQQVFAARWRSQLAKGDSYYSSALSLRKADMSLKSRAELAAEPR